ncbi:MAG TPA: histidine kinase [Blastocatellia bacterium]|nr:histidine kinase [Blastocatellia bacterium]
MAEPAISPRHFGHSVACPCVFGKTLTERWGARVGLILAATITSSLLKYWMLPAEMRLSFANCLFTSFVYSTCIGLEFFYSFHLFSERITRQVFPLNWFLLFLTVLVSALIGFFTGGLILVALGTCTFDEFVTSLPRSLRFSLLLGLTFGIGFFLYESLRRQLEETTLELRTKQLEEERARKLAIAAQLSSLESRVRPHFLFNTLNSISALIREEPAQAERMVERLSAMLRFSLDSNQRNAVLLRDEVKIVRDYLEIEQARFGERLRFQVAVAPELGMTTVPPFALQTLVENSIKHVVSARREGGEIQVKAEADGDAVKLEVWDDGPGCAVETIPAGRGIDNLQARLYALYGDQASLEFRQQNGHSIAALTLPRN